MLSPMRPRTRHVQGLNLTGRWDYRDRDTDATLLPPDVGQNLVEDHGEREHQRDSRVMGGVECRGGTSEERQREEQVPRLRQRQRGPGRLEDAPQYRRQQRHPDSEADLRWQPPPVTNPQYPSAARAHSSSKKASVRFAYLRTIMGRLPRGARYGAVCRTHTSRRLSWVVSPLPG